jgi:hypothetical protein
MKNILLALGLAFVLVGCQPAPTSVVQEPTPAPVRPRPVVVVPVEQSILVVDEEPLLNSIVVVENDNSILPAVCKCGQGSKCICPPGECKCEGCPCNGNCKPAPVVVAKEEPKVEVEEPEVVDDVPPQKVANNTPVVRQTTPPATYREPPIPAGYVRTYFWQNGKRWYKDVPRAQPRVTYSGGCANGGCSVATRPMNTAGMHSHKCESCGYIFSHVSGSHMCPNCGRGPWYIIYDGPVPSRATTTTRSTGSYSSGSSRGAILPWRR